jgi:hypothetical protein
MQLEEGGKYNQNPPEAYIGIIQHDIEALASTNEYYKEWCKETTSKNPGSPNVSQKSTFKKQIHEIIVRSKEGIPLEIQMMVEIKTLPKR